VCDYGLFIILKQLPVNISVSAQTDAALAHAGSIACCQFYFMRFADLARFLIHDFSFYVRVRLFLNADSPGQ
jgi:hypothetical protein